MRVAPSVRGGDLGTLLGLNDRGILLLYLLFSGTFVALSFSAGHLTDNPFEAATLVLILACGALVSAPGPYPLRSPRVAVILGAIVFALALANSQLPDVREREFSDWHFGAVNFLLFALAIRGRIAAAWIGMALMCLVTTLWSVIATGSPLHGIELVYGQTAALVAGTFFAILLRRTASSIRDFQQIERQRIAQEHLVSEGERERATQLRELRDLAEGPLSLIASGAAVQADRQDFLLLEATLRDRIRARSLCREPLMSAVQDARRKGSEVVLLDDLGTATEYNIGQAALEWATTRIRTEASTNVTVRLSADGPDTLLTYVAYGAMPQRMRVPASPGLQ